MLSKHHRRRVHRITLAFPKDGIICAVPFRSEDVSKHRKTCWGRCKVISSQAASAAEANARMNERDTSSVSDYYTFLPSLFRRFFFHRSIISMQKFALDGTTCSRSSASSVILLSITRTRNKSTISKDVIAKLLLIDIAR